MEGGGTGRSGETGCKRVCVCRGNVMVGEGHAMVKVRWIIIIIESVVCLDWKLKEEETGSEEGKVPPIREEERGGEDPDWIDRSPGVHQDLVRLGRGRRGEVREQERSCVCVCR